MPQAIQPGSYTAKYSQQLVQTLLMQATQMLAGGAGGLGGLTGQPAITNPALIANIDNALNSTVVSLDTQLASVGIGVSSGIPQTATAPPTVKPVATPTAKPTATPTAKPVATPTLARQADAPLSLATTGNLSALA